MTIIKRFCVPDHMLNPIELKSVDMDRLGRFVALTGKNGAGKSRVLGLLPTCVRLYEQHRTQARSFQQMANDIELTISSNPNNPSLGSWRTQKGAYESYHQIVTGLGIEVSAKSIKTLSFVPKLLSLQDPRQKNQQQIIGYYQSVANPGFDDFPNKCFSYIQQLQNRYMEATHQMMAASSTDGERKNISSEYDGLRALIKSLLKTDLDRSNDGEAKLFGRALAESNLSEGQKVIVQFVVALHAQKSVLDNTIFLMDEPENHLHPSALIEFFEDLSKIAPNAQFWIATHSVPLLAYIAGKEPMSIWYVEEGAVSNAGRHPEAVLRGLLGTDEQIDQLHSFAGLPAQFAASNFAAESLIPPKTVGANSHDRQVAQVAELLEKIGANSCVSLLDFGAGKGRLLAGLAELIAARGQAVADRLDYIAIDPSDKDREICLTEIRRIYGENIDKRHHLNQDDFFAHHNESSIDVVVMCNVLHEIPPGEWLSTFNKNSLIVRALKDDGYLLIVEDQRIPVGEKAHQFGFLVLDTPHLKTLFGVTEQDQQNKLFLFDDHSKDGRLKAHFISKSLLGRVTADTRKKAVEQLLETSKNKIKSLRKMEPVYPNGQMNGFWTQQLANAVLYLEQE